jgi:hypothetical protein
MAVEQRRTPSSITYVTPEEQKIEQIQQMKQQPIAHATLLAGMRPAVVVRFPWVAKRPVPKHILERARERAYERPYHAAFNEPKALPLLPEAPRDTGLGNSEPVQYELPDDE